MESCWSDWGEGKALSPKTPLLDAGLQCLPQVVSRSSPGAWRHHGRAIGRRIELELFGNRAGRQLWVQARPGQCELPKRFVVSQGKGGINSFLRNGEGADRQWS